MKAITLHQPWASLIAAGFKTVETRSWPTNVRGPIAIHAGKKAADSGIQDVKDALPPAAIYPDQPNRILDYIFNERWVLGAIVAIADVRDCRRMDAEWIDALDPVEQALGDHKADRYGWILGDVQRIEPVACRGSQGIWDVPDDVAQAVKNQTFDVGWAR